MALFITRLWKSVILTTTASLRISTLSAMLENSLIFETGGCCSHRLFYQLAGFNQPSISSNAEQWVSSISKGCSIIEFTFSEGFCTCANAGRTYGHKWPYLRITLLPFSSRPEIHKVLWLRGWVPSTGFFLVLLPFCYQGYIPSIFLIKTFMNQIRVGPFSVAALVSTKASGRRFSKTKWPFSAPSIIAARWCVQGQRASAKTPQLLN